MRTATKSLRTGQVAALIGCDRSTVFRIAKRLGIGTKDPLGMLFSEKQAARIVAAFDDPEKFIPSQYRKR